MASPASALDLNVWVCDPAAVYRPRNPEATVFYQVFEQYFDTVRRRIRRTLRAPLRSVAPRGARQCRAVSRLRAAAGRFCSPSLPFVQERTPDCLLMPHSKLLWQLSGQARRFVCRETRKRHPPAGSVSPLDLHHSQSHPRPVRARTPPPGPPFPHRLRGRPQVFRGAI